MVVKTYKEINKSHVIRHSMYDVFIMLDPNKNSKEIYGLFKHSGRFTLQHVINYVDT